MSHSWRLVYFAVPEGWAEGDERRVVAEVAALLPPRVQLEFEGRYAAMLSHEPKNYALLRYDGSLILHGVAFRSSRAEPFGEAFLRKAIRHLLVGDVPAVREAYLAALDRLRRRELPTRDISCRVRLTKTPAEYFAVRESRRELPYEAMLASGRTSWSVGDRIRVLPAGTATAREPPVELVERDGQAAIHPQKVHPATVLLLLRPRPGVCRGASLSYRGFELYAR